MIASQGSSQGGKEGGKEGRGHGAKGEVYRGGDHKTEETENKTGGGLDGEVYGERDGWGRRDKVRWSGRMSRGSGKNRGRKSEQKM